MTIIFSIGNEEFVMFIRLKHLRLSLFNCLFNPLKGLVEFMVKTCISKSTTFVG